MRSPLILKYSFWYEPLLITELINIETNPHTKEAWTCHWKRIFEWMPVFWETSFGNANLNWPSKFTYVTKGLAEGRGDIWRPESEEASQGQTVIAIYSPWCLWTSALLGLSMGIPFLFPGLGPTPLPYTLRFISNVTLSLDIPTPALQAKSESLLPQHFICS